MIFDTVVNIENELPNFMAELIDFQYITKTEDIELQLLYLNAKKELYNTFISTCDIEKLRYFENLVGITSNETIAIETRRNQILMKWLGDLPYTHKRLIQKLNFLLGKGNYNIKLDNNKYNLHIITHFSDRRMKPFILKNLRDFVPANLGISNDNTYDLNLGTVNYSIGVLGVQTKTQVIGERNKLDYKINILNFHVGLGIRRKEITYII